jgi:hypothetical protein
MTAFLTVAASFAMGFAGYQVADYLARKQLEWQLERLCDPRLPPLLAKRFTDDRLRFMCKSLWVIRDALEKQGMNPKPLSEEYANGNPAPSP